MIKMNFNNDGNIIDGIPDINQTLNALEQNYPNPFNDKTSVSFVLVYAQDLELIITDVTGKIINQRQLGTFQSGENEISLDGSMLQSGTYFYTLKGTNYQQTRKMTVFH